MDRFVGINPEDTRMASRSPRQKRITGRVMHELKHGELKSGRGGKAGKVKNRRQAIAIALEEAGNSKYESERRNKRNLRRTEGKEAAGGPSPQGSGGKADGGGRRQPGKPPRRGGLGRPQTTA